MHTRSFRSVFLGLLVAAASAGGATAGFDAKGTVEVVVDAREAPRRRLHSRLMIPVSPGPLKLLYPKWIPGEHGPTGPINELAGLRIRADGRDIKFRRDNVDMFAFHCVVPDSVETLDVSFDALGAVPGGGQAGHVSSTPRLTVLNWNQVVMYPAGVASDELRVRARLKLPEGWGHGTALRAGAGGEPGEVEFRPTTLTTLFDSPVIAGRHFRSVDLAPGGAVTHRLELAADGAAALEIPPAAIEGCRRLVAETGVLFGARHYQEYHFLLALSDPVGHFGLEHHESSENRLPERSFIDPDLVKTTASLLPHEMVHSWNGKHRRPERLTSPDYNQPVHGELLWIYEGLTTYLGRILPARAGLWSPEDFRDHLAVVAADAEHFKGRGWRSLADAGVAASQLYNAGQAWGFRRWSADASFYDGGELLWLEVDALIREISRGGKSLDDFCRTFHGGDGGRPSVRPYQLKDVVAALDSVAPHDWAGFLAERVDKPLGRAPLGGLERSGWRLVYKDRPTAMDSAVERTGKWGFDPPMVNLTYSLGLFLKEDGAVADVVPGMAADRAGLSPGVKVVAVNGRRYSPTRIRDAVSASRDVKEPIDLLTEDGDFFTNHEIDYHDGPRRPHLERIEARPDLLSKILAAKAKP